MTAKPTLLLALLATAVGIGMLLSLGAGTAQAQCGSPEPSSCTTCHAREDPVSEKGAWHTTHAAKDICVNCHGGNGSTVDKDAAHNGMTAHPLEDIYTDCHSCHPDYNVRAGYFAPTLGVTPGSCATPTSAVGGNARSGTSPSGTGAPTGPVSVATWAQTLGLAGASLALLAFFCASLTWLESHRAVI